MNYYFITGASRGIGKSLCELLLKDSESIVLGYSRNIGIRHQNYFHLPIDLSRVSEVSEFVFPEAQEAESICLINNAAMINEISHFGKLQAFGLVNDLNANLIAPAVLCNQFLMQYQDYSCKRTILNISSGASRVPLESCAAYCASKSGLEMLSRTIDMEQKLRHHVNPVRIFSVMPGVVDTKMQEYLRSVPEETFTGTNIFTEFKKSNQLSSPEVVAGKLFAVLKNPELFSEVHFHVNDIDPKN